jgi:hypothetical protein
VLLNQSRKIKLFSVWVKGGQGTRFSDRVKSLKFAVTRELIPDAGSTFHFPAPVRALLPIGQRKA